MWGHPGNGRGICLGAAPVFDASLASEDEAIHAVHSKGEVWGHDKKSSFQYDLVPCCWESTVNNPG